MNNSITLQVNKKNSKLFFRYRLNGKIKDETITNVIYDTIFNCNYQFEEYSDGWYHVREEYEIDSWGNSYTYLVRDFISNNSMIINICEI